MGNGTVEQKKRLRAFIKEKLNHLPQSIILSKSRKIISNLMNMIEKDNSSGSIGLYFSTNGEVSTVELIEALLRRNIRVALPAIEGDKMIFKKISSIEELHPGPFGIPHPEKNGEPISPSLLVIPALAFDRRGVRLGRGRGYYDRYLRGTGHGELRIGLCFHFQFYERLPCSAHDERVDVVVTEYGVFHTTRRD